MKKILIFTVSLMLVLSFGRRALAATAKVRLELNDALTATAILDSEGNKLTACRVKGRLAVAEVANADSRVSVLGWARAGDDWPSSEEGRFVVDALSPDAEVECTTSLPGSLPAGKSSLRYKANAAGPWISVGLVPLTYNKAAKATGPNVLPAFSPGIDWFAYTPRWQRALLSAIGEPKNCKVFGPGGVEKKDITCTPGMIDAGDGHVQFKLEQEFEPSQLSLTFSGGNAPELKIRVLPCAFDPNGPLPSLVLGAARQRMRFTSRQRECLPRLDRLSALYLGGKRIAAKAMPEDPEQMLKEEAPGRWVEIDNVPMDLGTGEQTLQLKNAGGALGTIGIVVLETISAGESPKVAVHYQLPGNASTDMSAAFQGADGINDGIAVVTPSGVDPGSIDNTVKLSLPSLPASDGLISPSLLTAAPKPPPGSVPLARAESMLIWRALSAGPATTQIDSCAGAAALPCELKDRPDVIVFRAKQATEQPISTRLALVRASSVEFESFNSAAGTMTSSIVRQKDVVLLEIDVKLAKSARKESVPLPIRDRLLVDCQDAAVGVMDGHTRSIDDNNVVNGACALIFMDEPIGLPDASKWKSLFEITSQDIKASVDLQCGGKAGAALQTCQDQERLVRFKTLLRGTTFAPAPAAPYKALNAFFGPQRLLVTFKRDGAEIASQLWDIDPDAPNWLVLPKGADAKRGDVYEVEVRIAAKSTGAVPYRGAVADEGNASLLPRAELRFHASLRSRGIFGIKPFLFRRAVGVRVYATVPVQLTGFRFRAAPRELTSSTDPTSFQYLTPRAGLLGVVEPWNYDTGQNAAWLNPNISVGLLALELTKPRVDLSFLAGVQVKLPLGDASGQLSSSAALGLFYERDLSESHANLGNRFLLTFGANVFSLFSGK